MRVVRDVQVRPAVLVVVEPGDAQAEGLSRVVDARCLGDLAEVAVAVVAEEQVPLPREPARAALHRDAAIRAGGAAPLALHARAALAEDREAREVHGHVAAHEQIEVAVAVVVREAAAHRPAARGDAGLRGEVREGAVAVVAVVGVAAEAGHVDVLPAVAVDVGRAHAHRPGGVSDAGPVGHVLEPPVAEVAVEHAARGLGVARRRHLGRRGQVDVEQAVVVVVEEGEPGAHRLHDVVLLRGGVVLDADAGLARDVAEDGLRRWLPESCARSGDREPTGGAGQGRSPSTLHPARREPGESADLREPRVRLPASGDDRPPGAWPRSPRRRGGRRRG